MAPIITHVQWLVLPAVLLATVYVHHLTFEMKEEMQSEVMELQKLVLDQEQHLQTEQQQQHQYRSLQQQPESTCDCPSAFTYASEFGTVGDGVVDDSVAIQNAINSASSNDSGGTVILGKGTFKTTVPLLLPGGITLKGQGYGDSPLAISFNDGGSVIGYCGTDYAVKIQGHSASIENLAVYDWRYPVGGYCDSVKAAGGVIVEANGRLVESVSMKNVFLYWFMGGTALTLKAFNAGGIAYGSFSDLRVRHAKQGIRLVADETSFTNSNTFYGGAISGGITDIGLLAEGPGACNDNSFYSMVIEPSATSIAHVHVKGAKTNVRMHDARLEGSNMNADQPLVIIENDSYGNVMNGMLGHTFVQADFNRNPGIDLMSAKSVGLDPAPLNLFWNAAFHGFVSDGTGTSLPGWSLVGTNANLSYLPDTEALYADHQVLRVDYLNYGGAFKLQPSKLPSSPAHSSCTFGVYARSSVASSIQVAMKSRSQSTISSASHSGSGEWEFIGMSALYDATNGPQPKIYITGDVDITAPTFVYGSTPATPGAELMSSSGAQMSGTLSLGMVAAQPPTSGVNWVLPQNQGNLFIIDSPTASIHRINDSTAARFPKGAVITLLFPTAGVTINGDGGYIKLLDARDLTITKINSSLTLVSSGSGSWTEVSRNV